jgi:FHA domain-containing protein
MFLAMTETETETKTKTKTTNLDAVGPNGWSVRDEVTQFREWGTHAAYPLPPKHVASTIGASRDCWLRLWDPNGSVSRSHAVLTHGKDGWALADLESKNGVFLDGARVPTLSVAPGAEIRIGDITLIAESPKLIALRALLERLIGWDDERREVVDQALYSVRIAATHREPLLLCGEGNLVPIARLLHQHALEGRPFVVARPRSRHAKGMDALAEAAGGTLCVWRREQPDDFGKVASALQGPQAKALLMVCAHAPPKGNDVASRIVTSVRSIVLPPLSSRARELRRIIDAYGQDAIVAFGGGWLAPADWEWIEQNASDSLQLIGMATRRIVALHLCDESVTQAAKLLSVSHGSLSDWLARRSLPGKVTMPDEEEEEQ